MSAGRTDSLRRALWATAALLAAFLLGFGWQFVRAERLQDVAGRAGTALAAARLDATLADAVIEVHQGNFESGRQRASAFFSGLQQRVVPALSGEPQSAARAVLARRDVTITTLARNDPASGSLLREVLAQYRAATARAGLDTVTAPRPAR